MGTQLRGLPYPPLVGADRGPLHGTVSGSPGGPWWEMWVGGSGGAMQCGGVVSWGRRRLRFQATLSPWTLFLLHWGLGPLALRSNWSPPGMNESHRHTGSKLDK